MRLWTIAIFCLKLYPNIEIKIIKIRIVKRKYGNKEDIIFFKIAFNRILDNNKRCPRYKKSAYNEPENVFDE